MKYELTIDGIKCVGCINRIKNVLENIKGFISYNITFDTKVLTITVKKESVLDEVIKKITDLGFEVEPIKLYANSILF